PEAPAPEPMSEPAPEAAAGKNRPVDVAVGLGIDKWTSGFKGTASAQFGWSVGGGYTFGDVFGGVSFRLGALVTGTSLEEGASPNKNTLTFTSFLVEPTVRLRLVDRRLYLTGALGLGGLSVGGVKPTSVVLDPTQKVAGVSGAIGTFEVRPAIGLQLHVTPGLVVWASPAISSGAKPQYFYQTLGRFELMFGAAYLF
ncbi:MAG TPA: outer membrane beta-barrel protein, partial [Polyangia bacterium]|nr:outer membrane beta-barrel protein [Polyangia bacterium]